METKALDAKFIQTERSTLKSDVSKMEQAVKIKDDRIRQLEQNMQTLQSNLDAVAKVLSLDPRVKEIGVALRSRPINSASPRRSR